MSKAEGEPSESASEASEATAYKSALGCTISYDPAASTLQTIADSTDVYNDTGETVSVAVQSHPDMDAQAVADGLALQSCIDGAEVQDTCFGQDSILAKRVADEQESNGVNQSMVFYAIPKGEGALTVEINGYDGMPPAAQAELEEMFGTFSLLPER